MDYVTEVVLFRARPGFDQAAVVEAAETSQRAVVGLDGYIDRNFGTNADGDYVDIVRWRDMASAEAAAGVVMAAAGFQRLLQVIDESSIRIYHMDSRSL